MKVPGDDDDTSANSTRSETCADATDAYPANETRGSDCGQDEEDLSLSAAVDASNREVRPGAFRISARTGNNNNNNNNAQAPTNAGQANTPPAELSVIDAESQLAITAEAYAVEEDDGGEAPPEAKVVATIIGIDKKRFYQLLGMVLLGLAVILGTILGALIPQINNDENNKEASSGVTTDADLKAAERANKLQFLANELSALAGKDVFDPTSPNSSQHRINALEWLADDIPDTVSSTQEDIIYEYYPKWRITQRYISALLYYATSGPGEWVDQLNFVTEYDECEWSTFISNPELIASAIPDEETDQMSVIPVFNAPKGLTCNNRGRIVRIYLEENNLVGTIPEEIAFLDELAYIGLATNSLGSAIPPGIGRLSKLRTLLLRENCFTGTVPTETWSGLESLGMVQVNGNYGLGGSLNGLCNGSESKRPELSLLADCDSCPGSEALVECDCCDCCNSQTRKCCDKEGTFLVITAEDEMFTWLSGMVYNGEGVVCT